MVSEEKDSSKLLSLLKFDLVQVTSIPDGVCLLNMSDIGFPLLSFSAKAYGPQVSSAEATTVCSLVGIIINSLALIPFSLRVIASSPIRSPLHQPESVM